MLLETLRLRVISVDEVLALVLFQEEDLLVDVVVGCEYAYLAPADSYIIEPLIKALPASLLLLLEIAKDVSHGTEGGLYAVA